jgi:hypothetical protein
MDRLIRGSKAAPPELREMSEGVILWHLSTSEKSHLWCVAFELPDCFWFVLDDDPFGTKPFKVAEQHRDIISIVDHAEGLKRSLMRVGWAEVDVE